MSERRTYELLEASDHQETYISLQLGETIDVIVYGIASTGYGWELSELPQNLSFAFLNSQRYEEKDPEAVGGGHRETWTFRARGPVRGKLVLSYRRFWEDEASARSLTLIINC